MLILLVASLVIGASAEDQDWFPVQRDVDIEYDLEATPLEIQTNSTLDSKHEVRVNFYSSEGDVAGGVVFNFTNATQYYIDLCSTSPIEFQTDLPSKVDKVWRISLIKSSGVRLVIHCNDVEALNTLLSDSTCGQSDWSTSWDRDVAKIQFGSSDDASDFYRPKPRWTAVQNNATIDFDLESTPLEIKTDSTLGSSDEVWLYFRNSEEDGAGGILLDFSSTPQYYLDYCSTSPTDFPVTLPSVPDRLWRITLTKSSGIRLMIHCNDVEVLNILISASTCGFNFWSEYWNRDVAKIKFSSTDTASDYYKPQPVDGGWTEFTDWSNCSVTCGGGTQNRTRTCSAPITVGGGSYCEEQDIEYQECSIEDCTVQCDDLKPWDNMAANEEFPVDVGTVLELSCFNGYELRGDDKMTCSKDKSLAYADKPQCVACEPGFYMSNSTDMAMINCTLCEGNAISLEGAQNCTDCDPELEANVEKTRCVTKANLPIVWIIIAVISILINLIILIIVVLKYIRRKNKSKVAVDSEQENGVENGIPQKPQEPSDEPVNTEINEQYDL